MQDHGKSVGTKSGGGGGLSRSSTINTMMFTKENREFRQNRFTSTGRSWSWNESGGVFDREIWSESDGALVIFSLETETYVFSSCVGECVATSVEEGAFCEEARLYEGEVGSLEPAQLKQ